MAEVFSPSSRFSGKDSQLAHPNPWLGKGTSCLKYLLFPCAHGSMTGCHTRVNPPG